MARHVAHRVEGWEVNAVLQRLHRLVTYGPGDLDIAFAMSAHGYDAVKWAEGQSVLAELISCDRLAESNLAAAAEWCQEAATVARCALAARPLLLHKLGVTEANLH
jgi:hypothetical protein